MNKTWGIITRIFVFGSIIFFGIYIWYKIISYAIH